MRNLILSIALLGLSVTGGTVMAQKPEKIVSIVQVAKPNSYYVEQADLWKKETEKNKKNAEAWLNYYKANRYMQISGEDDNAASRNRFTRLNKIVDQMEKNIPNTFEFNYVKWWNGYNDQSLFPYLQKAYELAPDRSETYLDFVTYYEVKGNTFKRDEYLQKWYKSGNTSPGLMNYNYNVLMSLAPNAILLTGGDNDTYYPWVLQVALGVRRDVTIVNTALASIKEYSQLLTAKFGVNIPNNEDEKYNEFSNSLMIQLTKNKLGFPVYAALTLSHDFTKNLDTGLYLVGLAYLYSTEKPDNIALLKKNMEKEYALDYLKISFQPDSYHDVVVYANSNYLLPMITLYNHYKLSWETEHAAHWKEMITMVANKCGMEDQVKEYIKD